MSSSNHWITLFIEHCLSSYATGRDPGSHWEDDGSNIRFSSSDQQLARIIEWGEVNDVPRPRLSDLDTQIEAVLSGGSLQEYNREFPNKPLSRDRCLGYTIQLDDFELVYEYSAGKPNVHLYVKRFNIVWARDKAKEPPRGKLVTKKPALITLLKRVLSSIRSRHKPDEPSQETANTVDSSGQSNESGDILVNGHTQHVQRQLMSQLPRPSHPRSPNQSPIHDAAPSGKEPLGQTRSSKDQQPNREMSVDAQPLHSVHAPEAVRHRSTSHMSTGNVHHGPREKQSAAAAGERATPTSASSEPFATQVINHPSPEKPASQNPPIPITEQQSPKRVVERSKSPDSPDRQLQSQLQSCGDVPPLSISHDKNANSNIADPWEGMTGISSADVTVPDDQKKLLESDPTPWYPPPVGYQVVSGNVPLALLAEWNELAFRRNEIGDSRPKSVDDDRPATASTSDNETSSDSSIPWSVSPKRTPSRGVVLPRDSSPLRDYSARPQRSRSARDQNTLENNLANKTYLHLQNLENSVPELDENTEETFKAPIVANTEPNTEAVPPAHDDGGHVSEGSMPDLEKASDDTSSDSGMNNAPDVEVIAQGPADRRHKPEESSDSDDPEMDAAPNVHVNNPDSAPGNGHESDSSSDSEMSVIVPQPLIGGTQQETSTQEEVPSSGPSLPESARHNVQVVETPAVLSKSRPALSSPDASRTDLAGKQSQSDNSSQSRILNTYGSHEGDSIGGTSQESSRSLPATASDPQNRVNVMGTPLSSQAQPTQPTPLSASNFVYTSSGPNVVEGSVPAASIYQSSKAFSSYREMPPSSMLSIDDRVSPSIQSSVRASPLRPDRVSPLKRFASEFDSDRGSPSKRSKLDHEPTAVKAEGGLNENIIARHQNYIINSAQSVEAAGVYEKFRGDYPNYAGDYEHFIKLCSKLQSFRDRGSLQRSFLWDDFIIKHLETYPSYLAECHYNHTKPLEYEEYFAETFSKPTYKRRNLNIPGISACAAQVITIDEPVEPLGPNDAKTSFTASLREQLSNLHTHSFRVQDSLSQDRQSEDGQSEAQSESASLYSIPDSEPARAAAREHGDEDMNIDHSQETDDLPTVWEDSDEHMEDAGIDAGIDADVNDTVHETASIELGDDETLTVFPTPVRSRSRAEPLPDSLVLDRDNDPAPVSTSRRSKLPSHATPENPAPDVASEEDSNSNKDNQPAPGSTPKQKKLPTSLAVEIPAPGTTPNISSVKGTNEPVIQNEGAASNAVGDPNIQEQDIEPAAGPSLIHTEPPVHPSPRKPTSTFTSGAAVPNRD
ncbi:hypothetical protein BDW75DRAFT_224843, partial [Aspergillus navahoensis]